MSKKYIMISILVVSILAAVSILFIKHTLDKSLESTVEDTTESASPTPSNVITESDSTEPSEIITEEQFNEILEKDTLSPEDEALLFDYVQEHGAPVQEDFKYDPNIQY